MENWLVFLLVLALTGLVVGALARLLVPGRDSLGVFSTILIGIAGSFIGGLAGRALFGETGWLGSLVLAVLAAALLVLPFRYETRALR